MKVHRPVAASAHLPPAGQTRGYGKTLALPGLILLDQIGHLGSRSYKAHRPSDDVEKLRKFIQAEAPKQASDTRNPRIILRFVDQIPIRIPLLHLALQLLRVPDHRPEF